MLKNLPLATNGPVRKLIPYIIALIVFILFKLFVPHPWLSADAWDYVAMSLRGDPLGHRPTGYSTLLRYIHDLGGNHTTIVYFQFISFLICAYLFLERLFEMLRFSMSWKIVIWCLTIYNPIVLYLSNFLTTDILFAAITVIWLLSLINSLTVEKKAMYIWAVIHLLCYYFLFALRYNALYYPGITLVAILLFKSPVVKKIALFGISVMLVASLVKSKEHRAEDLTGTAVFSALGSWGMANNALHIYKTEDVEDVWTDEMSILHTTVMKYKDSIRHEGITDAYLWLQASPLKQYLGFKLQFTKRIYISEYYAVAPLYRAFAMDLIKTYPLAFVRNFYLPNLQRCFAPPLEIMDFSAQSIPPLDSQSKEYIGLKQDLPKYSQGQIATVTAMKYGFIVTNVIITVSSLVAIVLFIRRRKTADTMLCTLTLLSCFHLSTILLLAFAHPVCMRYLILDQTLLLVIPVAVIGVFKNTLTKSEVVDANAV